MGHPWPPTRRRHWQNFWHGATNFGQGHGDTGNGFFEFDDAFALALLIWLAIHEEKANNGVLAEQIPQFLAVDIRLALLRTAVRGDNDDLCARLTTYDKLRLAPLASLHAASTRRDRLQAR
jgi:hypothetical protein